MEVGEHAMGADDADIIGPRPFSRVVVKANQQVKDEQHTHHAGQPHRGAKHNASDTQMAVSNRKTSSWTTAIMIQENLHNRSMCLE